jgi:hypothetical protein
VHYSLQTTADPTGFQGHHVPADNGWEILHRAEEVMPGQVGSKITPTTLSEVLLVDTLRLHADSFPASGSHWPANARDPVARSGFGLTSPTSQR